MFPSLSLAAVLLLSPTPPPADNAVGNVEDLVFPVEDIIGEVESLDGTETETKQGKQVTVALTSDVLFALDKWALTGKAGQRLAQVAARVKAEGAAGQIKVLGHTDDQGADAYNLALSRRRAAAVERALRGRLPGFTFQVQGFGESRPKLPNLVDGSPVEANRAKNRRVEIVFDARQ
ncbi:MAG: OmpA family protein [Nonomuraea sp.]|nr:OmpA family protein [Nonomuraea sp.]